MEGDRASLLLEGWSLIKGGGSSLIDAPSLLPEERSFMKAVLPPLDGCAPPPPLILGGGGGAPEVLPIAPPAS